jgi:YrbI family 3-deoxy-D-manno-octulosonate 8-phosphate phosphatase
MHASANLHDALHQRLAQVKLLLVDVDGVLTEGGVTWTNEGIEQKTFHIRDGLGIRLWQRAGGRTGIVTGRASRVVQLRAEELGIGIVRQGVEDKLETTAAILAECGVAWEQTAFVGDDLPDLAVMMRCGVGVAVAITIIALPALGVLPTSMLSMLTPASPNTVPTRPITPGRSSLRTINMNRAGGTSLKWSSMSTMRLPSITLRFAECFKRTPKARIFCSGSMNVRPT